MVTEPSRVHTPVAEVRTPGTSSGHCSGMSDLESSFWNVSSTRTPSPTTYHPFSSTVMGSSTPRQLARPFPTSKSPIPGRNLLQAFQKSTNEPLSPLNESYRCPKNDYSSDEDF